MPNEMVYSGIQIMNSDNTAFTFADDVHSNDRGHGVMAERLEPLLRKALERSSRSH